VDRGRRCQAFGRRPRIGSWKLVSADSALNPPRKLSIAPQGKGVHVVMVGSPRLDFTAGWDGHDNHVQNIPAFNQIVIRRIDKNQAEIKEKKNGALVATLRDKISSDRKELTSTTVQPGHEDQITVWERSEGMHDVANPFIWQLDRGVQQDSIAAKTGAQDRSRRTGRRAFRRRFQLHGKL
jgi:hypothetical protein